MAWSFFSQTDRNKSQRYSNQDYRGATGLWVLQVCQGMLQGQSHLEALRERLQLLQKRGFQLVLSNNFCWASCRCRPQMWHESSSVVLPKLFGKKLCCSASADLLKHVCLALKASAGSSFTSKLVAQLLLLLTVNLLSFVFSCPFSKVARLVPSSVACS